MAHIFTDGFDMYSGDELPAQLQGIWDQRPKSTITPRSREISPDMQMMCQALTGEFQLQIASVLVWPNELLITSKDGREWVFMLKSRMTPG